jgi:hypothetical protein
LAQGPQSHVPSATPTPHWELAPRLSRNGGEGVGGISLALHPLRIVGHTWELSLPWRSVTELHWSPAHLRPTFHGWTAQGSHFTWWASVSSHAKWREEDQHSRGLGRAQRRWSNLDCSSKVSHTFYLPYTPRPLTPKVMRPGGSELGSGTRHTWEVSPVPRPTGCATLGK